VCNNVCVTRKYEQRKRAEQQEDTRQRIVRAAVELHGQLGPARTTVSAVAERAGVQRNTFYRHFPDDRSLIHACSTLFDAENPLPDPEPWAEIDDPDERVRAALEALYRYWDRNQQLISNVLRDAEADDLVRQVASDSWGVALGRMCDVILAGWPARARSKPLRAVSDLAISFRTWQSLVHHSGLTSEAAACMMASLVSTEANREPEPRRKKR